MWYRNMIKEKKNKNVQHIHDVSCLAFHFVAEESLRSIVKIWKTNNQPFLREYGKK